MSDKPSDQTSSSPTLPEKPEQKPASGPATKQKASPAQPAAPVSRTAVLALAVSVITLGVIGAAGWYAHKTLLPTLASQSWVEQQVQQNTQNTETTLNTVVRNNTRLTSEKITEVSDQSTRLVTRMDNLARHFHRLEGADRSDWKLAEAEYLLRLANQRLLTMHDLKSARTLLTQSDLLLVSVDEYGLFSVRQALAEDLASLKATPAADIDSTWLKLEALSKRIAVLPLLPTQPGLQPETTSSASENPPVEQSWQQRALTQAKAIWTAFSGQFRIRKQDDVTAVALLAPKQEFYLRQNLQLMIEQAQLALLQGRTEIYQASIANTRQWLTKYFLNQSAEVQAMQAALTELSQAKTKQRIPDISRSLTALKAYIDEKASQRLPVQPVKKKEVSGSKK